VQALVVVVVVVVVGGHSQNKGPTKQQCFFILKKGNLFYFNPSVNHPLEHVAKGMIMIIRL
jgi:hypothetical protein